MSITHYQAAPVGLSDSAFLAALPLGVYVCDRDGHIIRFNRRAAELWGREPTPEDRRCGSHRMLRPDGTPLPDSEHPMAYALRTGELVRDAELTFERPDRGRLVVSLTIEPLKDADGRLTGAIGTFQDISRRRRVDCDLRDFIDNASEGVHSVASDGIILWANQAELDLLGYEADEYVGRHIANFHVDGAVIEDILTRLGRGESLRNHEARLRCKDGSIRDVLINSNVLWRDGQFVHTRSFTRDVTDRRRSEKLLEEALRLREEFTLTLGHELRQPLAPMLTAVELLKMPTNRDSQQHAVDVLERQVRHMQRLVDDLLDAARIATGRIELRPELLDIRDIVLHVVEAFAAAAPQCQIVVRSPDEPILLQADSTRLQQILSNLLTNAAKFTANGGNIWVELSQDDLHVEVRVRDDGRGIAKERLDHIFDLYVQASNDGRGFGVGLSVVRRLVEAHGGTIRAFSEGLEQGSEFIVRLPLTSGADEAGIGSSPATRDTSLPLP